MSRDTTNMVAHDTMQPQALALVVLFPVLSTIFVALRVWIRITMQQFRWGACSELPQSYFFELVLLTCAISTDDGLCVVACVLAVAYAGVVYRWILAMHFGYRTSLDLMLACVGKNTHMPLHIKTCGTFPTM
jgi:hypothetical protein